MLAPIDTIMDTVITPNAKSQMTESINAILDIWKTTEKEFEEEFDGLLNDLDRFHDQFRGEELRMREDRLRIAEQRTKLAYDHAEWEAEQLDQQQSLQQQVHHLERERSELEMELENVRQHAEELADQLSEQKRLLSSERELWSVELRQLRQTLEKQSQTLSQRVEANAAALVAARMAQSNSGVTAGNPIPSPMNARQSNGDPVVDSVKTQFQMLQKDLAKRRSQQKPVAQ